MRTETGRIVILNGVPRSGKSSIAAAIQETFDGVWMNLGVDAYVRCVTPPRLRPGIGLRPGGERPDLEPFLPLFYAALYGSIAAHARLGLNVVTDVGHHDCYSRPLSMLADCARQLAGLPVLFVGVRCPLDVILARRETDQAGRAGEYVRGSVSEPVPPPVALWQDAAHDPGVYDLELDTSRCSPMECAAIINEHLSAAPSGPSAFERLAGGGR